MEARGRDERCLGRSKDAEGETHVGVLCKIENIFVDGLKELKGKQKGHQTLEWQEKGGIAPRVALRKNYINVYIKI